LCKGVQPQYGEVNQNGISLFDNNIDINISASSIILIETRSSEMRKLLQFKIKDISLLSSNLDSFCFVAKESTNDSSTRRCFIFRASNKEDREEICEVIYITFRINSVSSIPVEPKRTVFDDPKKQLNDLTKDLNKSCWYHEISREKAEALIHKDGQFLVRPSESLTNQIVLTGMYDGVRKHICLIQNQNSKIYSTIGEFDNIVHLITYYHKSGQPLISHDVKLKLNYPILYKKKYIATS